MYSTRRDPSSACHEPNRGLIAAGGSHGPRSDRQNPHDGCSRCRSGFPARLQRRICAIAVWPALIAAVTNLAGSITGAHRTWLDPTGEDKAPIDTPRRAMGRLLGHGVRFGVVTDVMAAGEGIETMLSVRSALPNLSMV